MYSVDWLVKPEYLKMEFINSRTIHISKSDHSQEKQTSFLHQYIAAITGCLAILSTGLTFGWVTNYLPSLLAADSPIPTTSSDGSWLVVMPCISTGIGCLASAKFVDHIGRKTSMLIATPLYFISWMLVAFGQSIYMLYAARFISGIADGIAYTVFPMYLGEIADASIRGLLSAFMPTTTVLGYVLVALCGSYFSLRNTSFISSVIAVLHIVLFPFMPETPYYLLMRNDKDGARCVLEKLRGTTHVKDELDRLEMVVQEDNKNKGSDLDLFRVQSNRKGWIIAASLRGLQQSCGQMVFAFYATVIFHESGSTLSPTSCTTIYFALQLITGVICSCLVDRVGRKPLLILSLLGACAMLSVEGAYFYMRDYTTINLSHITFVPVIALLVYNTLFNLGLGTIAVSILSELFPTNVKAFALCLIDIYFGIIVLCLSKFFQIMNDGFGMYIPFFVFAMFSFVGLLFIIFYIPETKGKTLEEIQELFKDKSKRCATVLP